MIRIDFVEVNPNPKGKVCVVLTAAYLQLTCILSLSAVLQHRRPPKGRQKKEATRNVMGKIADYLQGWMDRPINMCGQDSATAV